MVKAKRTATLAATLESGAHQFLSGVPEKLGGADEGPGPHQLVEAALAACTVLTVQMYANRKRWKLDSTDVEVNIESETREGTHIVRKISFRGTLSEEERTRLLDIADKCPIHKLLSGNVKIDTVLIP